MKIWLDTDIGSDIDDQFALAYLLRQPRAELSVITTCTGEAERRAALAYALCKEQGKEFPIFAGSSCPLTPDPKPHQRHLTPLQQAVADRTPFTPPSEDPLAYLRRLIERHPHEILLAAIGPLTNPAMLFQKYPHLPSLLAGAVLMCGRYGDCDSTRWGETEWNVVCDPLAASAVFAQAIPNCLVLGVEQTCRTRRDPKTTKKAFAAMPCVSKSIYPDGDGVWFHDAMAVAMLFERMGEWEQGDITVSGTETRFLPNEKGRHRLLRRCDPDVFFAHYEKTTEITL